MIWADDPPYDVDLEEVDQYAHENARYLVGAGGTTVDLSKHSRHCGCRHCDPDFYFDPADRR